MGLLRSHQTALESFQNRLNKSVTSVLKSPPKMNLPDWADEYRWLSKSSSAMAGPWVTSNVEIARGPMMAVTEPGVRLITVMVSTQTLKTSLLENIIGYFVHLDPSPILLLQPKDEFAEAFSKERLLPMVRESAVLKDLMRDSKSRKSNDTIKYKTFPGGFLALASAGSPTNLAMRAIRLVLEDEIDKYLATKEGDPILLAEERMATFRGTELAVRACSPTLIETSRIYKSFLDGDQRRAFIQCPHCGEWILLDFFKNVEWPKSAGGVHMPKQAELHCQECGGCISEPQRMKAVTTKHAIRWRQTRPFRCCDLEQDPMSERLWDWDDERQVGYAKCKVCGTNPVDHTHASFTAGKLYSPFTSVATLAEKFVATKDDPESKQTFINTQLGWPFSQENMKNTTADTLLARREFYKAEVPAEVTLLTAGVDVQAGGTANIGRFEVEVVGWGADDESWSIGTYVISGDPATKELWDELEEVLVRPYKHELGFNIHLMGACIDTGGYANHHAFEFCRKRIGRNIWPIKGASDRGSWSTIWPDKERHEKFRTGYKPIIIGVSQAKEVVRGQLFQATPGKNYCHFPHDRDPAWFDQLLAERIVLEKVAGTVVRKWEKIPGRNNEALDCRVYALAALQGLRITRRLKEDRLREEQVRIAQEIVGAKGVPPAPKGMRRIVTRSKRDF